MVPFNYVVVQNKNTGMDAIKLLDEPFAGIIFSYGQIQVEANEEDNKININFEYEILDKGSKDFGNLEPFEEYIGQLLEHIIHSGIEQESNTMH